MFGLIKKIFGTAQSRLVKRYFKIVKEINAEEEKLQSLSDDELRAKTAEFKKRIADGEELENLLVEAYAVVKNTCRRLCGSEIHVSGYEQKWDMVPYDVQIVGAISMFHGSIAEMQTGEGKTLTASMPLYLYALSGKPVHLVTVNDYLAQRDCDWIGTVFRWHGMKVKALVNSVAPHERKEVYKADIVYGTASEFGFDYLRDNSMSHSKEEQVQRGFYFAIIDEVDSILIDEARTPLIISGPSNQSRQMYDQLQDPVSCIVRNQREISNRLASEARKTFEDLDLFNAEEMPKLTKEQQKLSHEAFKKFWVVGKGTPRNKILKRIKENPALRADLEKWETYYHADANKEERFELLAQLYIVIDERASDYELTDLGIKSWSEMLQSDSHKDDFMMLDLGHEYAEIDKNEELSDDEKLKKKIEIREEDSLRKERAHNLRQLLRAHLLMERDVDYIVQEGKIVIIDENTGRPQPGRRFSDGLHQAIEAKENVKIQQETQTYATITLQNYFRMYDHLAGMTGTAMTEAGEFKEIYGLQVLEIPTYKPCKRVDSDDQIFMTEREKYNAIIADIKEKHEQGRPILIGTESVEVSEKLARILRQNKLEHTVLNAKNHAREAEIIADAGKKASITVATNMAGRGTDIKLKEGVSACGGLHVIGTTRHQSRRIDRQLRGRSGRLGDPGSSIFFVSFEDELMRLFTSPRLTQFLQRFRPPEGEPISAGVLNKSIETAQKRIEGRNYAIRKHTLEYDDVMNMQRQEVYAFRNDILHTDDMVGLSYETLEVLISTVAELQPAAAFKEWMTLNFPVSLENESTDAAVDAVINAFKHKLDYQARLIASVQTLSRKDINPIPVIQDIIRSLMLHHIDRHWQEHLLHIDHLRAEVGMRAVAQKDPLIEFKHEAFQMFSDFSQEVRTEIAHALFKFEMAPSQNPQVHDAILKLQAEQKSYFLESASVE
ncbi:MAG: preprotein translocase subunit SecA [Chlamydiales bacterium]|nr:preprotein translocase subunit SecA [Chlamydiales bacterium]